MRVLSHLLNFALLGASIIDARSISLLPRQDAENSVSLNILPSPPPNSQTVDSAFVSYSLEFPNWVQYAGNTSHPNKFSYQLMENLKDISGELPYVRIGGTPQDIVQWNPNQQEGQIAVWPDGDLNQNPTSLLLGPAFVESFGGYPKDTKYIFGLTFGSVNTSGLQNTLMEAKAVFDALQKNLYAFEIGNEPEYYVHLGLRPANWSVFQYVPEWEEFADAIAQYDFEPQVNQRIEPIFQAGAFQAPLGINNISIWNAQSILELGIANTGQVKSISEHQYMGAASTGNLDTLLNRTVMTSQMYYHEFLSTYTVGKGYKYVLGETNTMSGHGLNGVSNALAAALWSVDYALYSATLNISRVHYHSGTVFRYSAWQPIDINSTSFHKVLPLYYGNLFTAHVFAGGDKQVAILVNETYFSAYGVYTRGCLESIVAINTNVVNATVPRTYSAVTAPGLQNGELDRAVVRRLTAPTSDAQTNVTFAGQTVDTNGFIVGRESLERVTNGQVILGSSEAVLISLQ